MAAERRKCLKSLELQEGATEEEIRKAYKRLALKYHPDKNDSDDAKGKFQEIGYAYKYLTEGARAFSPSDPFDMREEFVVRLFEEMFFSQFRGFGGFPFFYDESDEDDFYFDTDSDRECFCGYCHTTGARDAGKRTYPNKYPGPHTTGHAYRQPSKKHQKKMEKRQRHKERRKEKENQARNERQRATRNSYTDDINPEMKKETRDKSAPKPAEKKPEENSGSRPDTPTHNHQQQQQPTTKKQKKKEMSEQHKREREMEEIAAELTRKLEQEKKKQQEKQKQEAQKKQEEKENNINFNYMFENGKKSKRARQRERKREGTTSQTSSTYSGTTSAPRPPFSNINKSSDTVSGKPGKSGSTFDGRPRSGSRFDVLDDDFYDSDRGSSSVSSGSSVEAGSLRSRPEAGSLHSRPEAGSLHSRPEAGSLHSRPKLSVYYADNNKQPAGRDVLSSNSANLTASQSNGQTAQRYPRQQNDKSQGTNVNNFNYTNNRGFNSNKGDQWKIKKENQYETETGDQFGAKRNSPSFPSNFRTDQQNKSNIQFGFNVGLKSERSDQIGAKTRVPSGVTSSFRIENRPKVDIQFGYGDFVSSAQGPSNLKNTTATEIKSNAVNGEKVLANKGAQDMNKSNEAMESTAAKSDPLDGEKVNKAAHDITKTNGAVKSTAAENVALGVVDFEAEEGHQFVKDWSVYDSDDGDDADDDDDEKDQLNFGYGASRNPQQRNSLENGDNSRGYPQQRGREFIPRTRGNKVPKESVYGRPPVFDTGMRGPRYPPARGEMYPPPPPVHAYPPHRGEYPGQPPFRGEYPGQPPFRGEYSRPPPFRGEYSGPPPFKGEYPGLPPFRGEYPGPPPFIGDYPGPPPFNGEYHRPPPFRGDYSRPPPFRGEYHHTPFRGDYHGAPPSRGGNREPVGFNRGGYPVPKYESNTGKPENSVPSSLSHSDNKNISDNKKIPDAKTNQTTASSTSAMVNSGLNKPSDKPDKPSVSQNCGKAPSVISGNWSDTKANNTGPMKQNMFSDRASSGGSLDSLDDIDLCDNQSASTYSYELEDLGTAGKRSPSYIDIGLDEFLSRDNLGVPSAMFSDSIKNYYK